MQRGETGRYEAATVGGETVRAFVPSRLPPEPALELSSLQGPLERALLALGGVDALSTLLPDTHLFLYRYVRKEAVLSSQIEGTQSSLSDLLLFEMDEAPGVPFDDVVEVSNYVMALEHGLRRLHDGFCRCSSRTKFESGRKAAPQGRRCASIRRCRSVRSFRSRSWSMAPSCRFQPLPPALSSLGRWTWRRS